MSVEHTPFTSTLSSSLLLNTVACDSCSHGPVSHRWLLLAMTYKKNTAFGVIAILSLVSSPDPTHKMRKGLVTFEQFLDCAESAKKHVHQYIFVGKCHVNAESAQPRNCSNVTTPFSILCVGSGDETILSPAILPLHAATVVL